MTFKIKLPLSLDGGTVIPALPLSNQITAVSDTPVVTPFNSVPRSLNEASAITSARGTKSIPVEIVGVLDSYMNLSLSLSPIDYALLLICPL